MVYSYLFSICYLEHLDSLRIRHAKRLMCWLGYKLKWVSKEAIVAHFVCLRYLPEGIEQNNENRLSGLPGPQPILEPGVSQVKNTITTKIFIISI